MVRSTKAVRDEPRIGCAEVNSSGYAPRRGGWFLLALALAAAAQVACERTPPPLDGTAFTNAEVAPGTAAQPAEEPDEEPLELGAPEDPPPPMNVAVKAPPPLPTFVEAETEVEMGSRNLRNCAELNEHTRQALITHRLRARFPKDFGEPISAKTSWTRDELSNWALADGWAYYAGVDRIHAIELDGDDPAHVLTKSQFREERILGAEGEFLVGAVVGQRHKQPFITFDAPGGLPAREEEGKDYDSPATMWSLYERGPEGLTLRLRIDADGEPVTVHFHDGAAYLMARTKLRVARRTADQSRDLVKNGREPVSTRASLEGWLKVQANEKATPRYEIVGLDAQGRMTNSEHRVGCNKVWIPTDPQIQGDRLLTILRVDLRSWKVDDALSLAGRDFVVGAANETLAVVRPARGAVFPDKKVKPVSEIETFRLGRSTRPSKTALVDGVPVTMRLRDGRGWLLQTRWPASETLAFPIAVEDEVTVGEPETLGPEQELPLTAGGVDSSFRGKREFLGLEAVAAVAENVVLSIEHVDRALHITARDATTGAVLGTTQTDPRIQLIKWSAEKLGAAPGVLVAPIRALDATGNESSLLIARFRDRELTVTLHHPRPGFDPIAGTVRDNRYVTISRAGVDWVSLEDGKIIRSMEWKDAPPLVEIKTRK